MVVHGRDRKYQERHWEGFKKGHEVTLEVDMPNTTAGWFLTFIQILRITNCTLRVCAVYGMWNCKNWFHCNTWVSRFYRLSINTVTLPSFSKCPVKRTSSPATKLASTEGCFQVSYQKLWLVTKSTSLDHNVYPRVLCSCSKDTRYRAHGGTDVYKLGHSLLCHWPWCYSDMALEMLRIPRQPHLIQPQCHECLWLFFF